jgi:peptidoglycan/LPS O-acetylase OafA/YrhL
VLAGGLAVAAVVLFHAGLSAVTGGFVGVDIFFVISGFLITGLIIDPLWQGDFLFWEFYARRTRRILAIDRAPSAEHAEAR